MHKVVYRPKPGGRFVAPQLKPGTELQVTADEAKRLIATGAFERLNPEPAPAAEDKPAKGGRKERD